MEREEVRPGSSCVKIYTGAVLSSTCFYCLFLLKWDDFLNVVHTFMRSSADKFTLHCIAPSLLSLCNIVSLLFNLQDRQLSPSSQHPNPHSHPRPAQGGLCFIFQPVLGVKCKAALCLRWGVRHQSVIS